LREATYPPAAVNVPDVSSESMAAFQVFLYGRFWVFTEAVVSVLFRSYVFLIDELYSIIIKRRLEKKCN